MTDFSKYRPGLSDVASHAAAVTPNDSTDLTTPARGFYVGTGGDLEVVTAGGETVTVPDVPAGTVVPIRATRVRAANTSAAGIIALW